MSDVQEYYLLNVSDMVVSFFFISSLSKLSEHERSCLEKFFYTYLVSKLGN